MRLTPTTRALGLFLPSLGLLLPLLKLLVSLVVFF